MRIVTLKRSLTACGLTVAVLLGAVSFVGSDSSAHPTATCSRPAGLQRLVFSAAKYPNVRRHFRAAVRRGWTMRLVVNRPGADERRERLLSDVPTRSGVDRDEYPPAVGRGRGAGLERGR